MSGTELQNLKSALEYYGISSPDFDELHHLKNDYYKRLAVAVLKLKALNND